MTAAETTFYGFLSAWLGPPDLDLTRDICEGPVLDDLSHAVAELGLDAAVAEPALADLREWGLALHKRDRRAALDELEVEYSRLFLGPGLAIVPPYESVMLDGEPDSRFGPLWGPSTLAVRQAYRDAEFIELPGSEPPDYLPTELEFMGMLASEACAIPNEGPRQLMEKFAAQHLGRWAPKVAEAVLTNSDHPVYRSVAKLLTLASK